MNLPLPLVLFACLKSSRRVFHRNMAAIYCCPTARKLPKFFPCCTLLQFEACDLTQSHSINVPPGFDRLLGRSRRRWRFLVLTLLQCTEMISFAWFIQTNDKPQCWRYRFKVCRIRKDSMRFRMKLNVS